MAKRKCVNCQVVKEYILVPQPNGKRRQYIDEEGKKWKGAWCRDCYTKKHAKYQKDRYVGLPIGTIICPVCGKTFTQKRGDQKYCSDICQKKANY